MTNHPALSPKKLLRRIIIVVLALAPTTSFTSLLPLSDLLIKDELIFIKMDHSDDLDGWKMEGPGIVKFNNGWMEMYSPQQEMHHVLWCPITFPDSFIAEWEAQNLNPNSGLAIVFFAARGVEEEDIFDPSHKKRNGTFSHYTKGDILSYHISYYANSPSKPARSTTHLRKNNGFKLVSSGPIAIPATSTTIHRIKLIKKGPHIKFYVDDKLILNWTDDSLDYLKEGKIGLRQMKSSHFRYRNFHVLKLPAGHDQ